MEEDIIQYYKSINDISDDVDNISKLMNEILMDASINDVCNNSQLIKSMHGLISSITEAEDSIDRILSGIDNIGGMMSSKPIFKKISKLMSRMSALKIRISKEISKIEKSASISISSGKSPDSMAIVGTVLGAIIIASNTINIIISSMGTILSAIQNLPSMAVDGGGMSFGPTIKNKLMSKKIDIKTESGTIGNVFSKDFEKKLSEIENSHVSKSNKHVSDFIESVASKNEKSIINDGWKPESDEFNEEKINSEEIIRSIKKAKNMSGVQEPLPQYSELSTGNIRFMKFLSESFIPAASEMFGMPGL